MWLFQFSLRKKIEKGGKNKSLYHTSTADESFGTGAGDITIFRNEDDSIVYMILAI